MSNQRGGRGMALRVKAISLAVASCFSVAVPHAYGNPHGFAVVNGQASFNYNGRTLSVINTPGAIINWQGFSIGAAELTRFIQQSGSSSVLNRVIGVDPSLILGALQSNGRVFLLNPNGIMFGAGSQVDVAGLVASTLHMTDGDFLAGRMRFTAVPGAGGIVNQGSITTPSGGQVYLIAPNVQNSGIITSPQGEIILAAGRSVELVDAGTPGLRVELTAPDSEAVNVGQIVANSGKVGIYAGLIRNSGVIRADGVVAGQNGEILLKATHNATLDAGGSLSASGAQGGTVTIQAGDTTLVSGTIEAKGSEGHGGTVKVLGNAVGLLDQAVIDASGQAGGGTVLVGGDYQGKNPAVQNAWRTYVAPGASIHADAVASGDGGKVIVWSDDATRVYGSISARGGAESGNGGFVETSGHRLDVRRGPDVTAPRGAGGTWLIDPDDLNVVAGSSLANNTGAPFFSPLAETSVVGADLINAQLNFGSNVVLTTTSQGDTPGAQAGNITVSAPLFKNPTPLGATSHGTTSLTLQAHNNIVIDPTGSITSTGDPLNVTLTANSDGVGGGGVTVGASIITNGGSFQATGRDLIAINAPVNTVRVLPSAAGNVFLNSTNGPVSVAASVNSGFFTGIAGGGALTLGSSVSSTGMSLTGRDGISVGPGVQISTGTGSFAATVTDPTSAASFTTAAGSQITANGATLISDNMDIQGLLNAGASTVTVRQNLNGRNIDLGTNTAGKLALTQAEFNNLVTTGSLIIGNGNTGDATVSASLTASVPGSVSVNAASLTQNAPVAITGSLTVTTDNAAINSTLTVSGNTTIAQRSGGRPVNLGAAADSGTAIDLSAAELNNIFTPVLRIGNFSTGAVTIVNPIAPANVGALTLTSGSQITQSVGATVNIGNLKLSTSGSVSLPQANSVGTLAGTASGFGGGFSFSNAAGTPLTIGSVDGTSGVSFNNSNGTINLIADNLTVASPVSAFFSNGAVVIQPVLAATKLNLGGADAAGVLGISAAELANISATTLTFKADQADISGAVTTSAGRFVVAPLTAGRALNIVGGPKNPANLEFLPAELGNVTASLFALGDAATGPVTVNAATTIPASVTTFTLQSGNTASGITVNQPLSANGGVVLLADTMNVNAGVSSTTGNISVATTSVGRPVDLGANPVNTLGLDATELGQFSTPGTLIVGDTNSGNVTASAAFVLTNAQNLSLSSGTNVTVIPSTGVFVPGSINVNAPAISIGGITSNTGDMNLTGDTIAVTALVTATLGNVIVAPRTFRGLTLGTDDTASTLGLTVAELNFLRPTAGVLRIGDLSNTANISVTAPIAPTNTTTLSLLARGSISQTAGSTITESNLRATSQNSSVNLPEANSIGTLAGSSSGSFSFTNAVPLTIGSVDGTSGISDSAVTLRSNEISINANIFASDVTLRPLTPGTLINVGTNVGGQLSFDQAELNFISAGGVTIGDATAGNITVSAPVNISSFSDLTLTTAGTINTAAALTNNNGNVTMVADAMTFGAGVNALAGTISLRPINALTTIDLGGPDVVSTTNTLGLDATDLGNLSAGALSFGSNTTPSISVTAATNLGTTPTSLTTAGAGTINVNAALTTGDLALTTDNLVILTGSVTAPNVTLNTVTAGRTVDLGTHIVGASLGLDQADLNRITTPGIFTVNNSGLINVSAPVSFPNAANLTLHGDTMTIGSTVTSPVGGRIIVAPRTFNRPMNLGSNPVAGTLALAAPEVDRFATSGVLQFGDLSTGTMTISGSIAPAGVNMLSLVSRNQISQSAGATIAETNLRVTSQFSSVNLPEANSVGTLAGSSAGSFTFTGSGALNIGPAVDGSTGISDSAVTIRADTLTLSGLQPIIGSSVTLAPRTAGAAMDLGSKPAGVFGITDAEMDTISASTVTFGTNTTGFVNVSAPMSRATGVLNIVTGPAQTVAINGDLSAPSGISVTGGTVNVGAPVASSAGGVTITSDAAQAVNINAGITARSAIAVVGGSINVNVGAPVTSTLGTVSLNVNALTPTALNVNAPVTGNGGVTLTSDVMNINAPVTAGSAPNFNSVTLRPQSANRPISLGTENPAALSFTPEEINQVSASTLTIGRATAGALTVTAPIQPANALNLSLQSGGVVTQNPGATIVTRRVVQSGTTTVVQGSLDVDGRSVDLRGANDVGAILSGSAFGPASDFLFNNVSPLKLQNISISATGKIRVNAGFFTPPVSADGFDSTGPNDFLAAFDRSIDFSAFDRKDKDEDAKSDEKEISKGLKAMCSS